MLHVQVRKYNEQKNGDPKRTVNSLDIMKIEVNFSCTECFLQLTPRLFHTVQNVEMVKQVLASQCRRLPAFIISINSRSSQNCQKILDDSFHFSDERKMVTDSSVHN